MTYFTLPFRGLKYAQARKIVSSVISFCCVAVFLCLPVGVAAQENRATLSGTVTDATGALITRALVTVTNEDTGAVAKSHTSGAGVYTIGSLSPGRYRILVEHQGFKQIEVNDFTLHVQDVISRNFTLPAGAASEIVQVNGNQNSTNDSPAVSTVISHEFIENMPLNGNDLTTLFELTPGTLLNAGGSPSQGGGFSVDGQRPTANYLTIDGASGEAYIPTVGGSNNNNTGAGIATSASGGTNGILPVDAIEEYRMDTSTYTAENGRTPGGQIQVRTRSGTNQFHGTLFENFRNQIFDANDWFANYDNVKEAQLRMNEFGGTLGGPILKNKLFFFVANDNLILDQPNTNTRSDVPDPSIVQGAYSVYKSWMPVFPSGNGGQIPNIPSFDYYSASYPALIRDHTTSIRADWQLPRSIHAFFRANIAPSSSKLPSVSGEAVQGEGSDISIDSYTGGLTIPLGARMLDDLTVNHTSNNTKAISFIPATEGNNPGALSSNLPTGVNSATDYFEFFTYSPSDGAYSLAAVGPSDSNELHQWNIVNTFSLHQSKHLLKFGVDFLTRQSILRGFKNYYIAEVAAGSTAPYSTTDLDTGTITELVYTKFNEQPTISLFNTSLFANDDWKIGRSLTLNIGIRWEFNPAPSIGPLGALALVGNNLNPTTFQDAVTNQPLYQKRYDNFAPRFGFAWTPFAQSSMVVRGGVGIYFDTGQAATTAGVSSATTYPYQYTENYSSLPYASVDWTGLAANQSSMAQSALYLVDPKLLSPRTYEWSLTVEQPFGKSTKLSTSYVGNDGEKLIGEDRYYNAKNTLGQYPVNTTYVKANGNLYVITNQSHSNYQALQMQFTAKIGPQLSALASYTWGHAEDNGSTDYSSVGAAALNPIADSANDIRHMFSMAVHYAPKGFIGDRVLRAVTSGWGFDTIARLQTATPVTVTVTNTADDNVNEYLSNADVIPGLPAILHEHLNSGTVVPGNKFLNWAAFTAPPTDSSGNQLRNGDSPTNGYRLFGLRQWDLAASRTWRIWRELALSFRVDAFNVLNTVNFGLPGATWNSSDASTFGRALYTYASQYGATGSVFGETGQQLNVFENGGPRELQFSMKLKF